MGAELIQEEVAQEGGVEGYDGGKSYTAVGGKRRKGSRKGSGSRSRKSKKGGKKMRKGHKGKRTRKGKRPPSKWILHVKAFCKKTGIKYPDALKNKECKASYKKL